MIFYDNNDNIIDNNSKKISKNTSFYNNKIKNNKNNKNYTIYGNNYKNTYLLRSNVS